MVVKVPQYEIILCVKINDVFKVISRVTASKFTLAYAKKYYKDSLHWDSEWEEVKVISINKAGTIDFDIPVNDLVRICTDYVSSKNENAIAESEEN